MIYLETEGACVILFCDFDLDDGRGMADGMISRVKIGSCWNWYGVLWTCGVGISGCVGAAESAMLG